MYLKSLTLKGFKSFADKSVLTVEPGVTCVVGPNGSGKSNISDAVLWVFGEQSAKMLRGQAMEDVIFAGSSARQAVGIAEVDLVLDNSDGALPLEFNEVTITRRMYRSGESEYLINQSPTRLMDVLDLLHDTGLGRDAHSIISQGRLGEILKARPEERRALIEEAAGVLKHKKRKERALRKLSGLDAHLERASDIADEIERQLRPLERQANKAATHSELVASLRSVDVSIAVDDLRNLQSQWDDISKVEKEADADIDLSRYRLSEKERELNKFQHLLEEKGLFVGDISEQRRRMQSILERLDAGLLLLEEKGKNLITRLSDLRLKLHNAQTRIVVQTSEQSRLAQERQETDAKIKELYSQLSELRREGEAARKARLAADSELSKVSSDIRQHQARVDDARSKKSKLEQSVASLTIQHELLQERELSLAAEVAGAGETLSTRRVRFGTLEQNVAKLKREIALANSDVDKRVRALESRKRDLDVAREDLFGARSEIKGLQEIDRAFASASPALARIVSRAAEIEGFTGPIADMIQSDLRFEPLVERLLGADLFGVFVEDSQAAMVVANEIASSKAGEISIVPLDVRRRDKISCPVGERLVDSLIFDEKLEAAIESLFGDVYVVNTLQEGVAAAKQYDGVRFVTLTGAVVWPSGKVTLGTQFTDNEGVLARKRRLNELNDGMSSLVGRVAECESEVSVAEEALSLAQQDGLELNQKSAAVAGERDSLMQEIGRLEEQLAKLTQEADSIAGRLATVSASAERETPLMAEIDLAIETGEHDLERLGELSHEVASTRDARFREEAAVTERLSRCQVEIATVSEREVHLKRQLTSVIVEVEQLEETIESSRQTEHALELLRERIQPLHELYEGLQQKAEHWAIMLRDRARFEQADSESLRTTIHDAQDKVRAVQAEITEKTEAISELRIKKGQLEVQVNQAVRRIVEEYGMPIEQALTLPFVQDRAKTEDEAFALRKRISNLGAVNPVAREEYDALRGRRDFMRTQIADLDSARKALGKVVAAIDRKMKEKFLQTFETVDAHFQSVFSVLFPGGSAQLLLTDPDDPDNTGVEYIAQPRGKKLKKMSLLSGGENSLAALALLFAVNKVRPCPFYILDEVEAALDDSNLRRFVNFVNTMRDSTQFLIVTHQRRTMEMADLLYGVSMQADGVSKLVSQKLDRALESLGLQEEDEYDGS